MFYFGRAYQGAKGPVYPYPFLDVLTDERVDKLYLALILENEYTRYCVLPEFGGRIFEAVDKTNGYDFFYRQHVIKPALIGMLGAWISGGVEWNIPHHHRAMTFLPMDWTVAEADDGSKTVWVGELELRQRMRWLVRLTLRPGSSVLESFPYYEDALNKDPGDFRVNTALGRLDLMRGMFEEAEAHLLRAVALAGKDYTRPKDGEALY